MIIRHCHLWNDFLPDRHLAFGFRFCEYTSSFQIEFSKFSFWFLISVTTTSNMRLNRLSAKTVLAFGKFSKRSMLNTCSIHDHSTKKFASNEDVSSHRQTLWPLFHNTNAVSVRYNLIYSKIWRTWRPRFKDFSIIKVHMICELLIT
jgi:hypothetical protein